jgi:membrane associated rhomboid family serine protease
VASHFLQILAADQRSARSKVLLLAFLALALLAPALFLAGWGGLWVHAGATAAGILAGLLLGRTVVRRYEASIRGTWTQWMRFAVAAETVPEIHRKVRGRQGRNLPIAYAGALTLIWGLEAIFLVLAFQQRQHLALAAPVIALNGLLAGGLLGYFLLVGRWYGTFRDTVREMVDSGEIGVWGVL